MLIFWIFGIITLITLIYWLNWLRVTKNKINKLPGPPTYPIIGNLLDIYVPSDELWNLLRDLGRKYYPVYRIWSGPLPAVAFLDPRDIELLLAPMKHITKSKLYFLLEPWLGKGLLTSTGSKWQNRRKILTNAFHFNILQQFVGVFNEQSEILNEELKSECDKEFTDVVPIITQFTLHSICETAMGTNLSDLKNKRNKYATAIYRMGELIVHRVLRPWLYLDTAYFFTPEYREKKKLVKFLHNFSKSVIKNRKRNFNHDNLTKDIRNENFVSKKRLAMLDLLISAQKEGMNIDDEGIREEVDTFMFEGHDTTAMSICFTLLLLANHKEIQDKVVDELRKIFSNSKRPPTYQDLQNMNYLELVLKESLRFYPSVPLIARVTDEEICTHSGYVIPEWVFVHIYIYDLHHNPDIYPAPHKFDPDRFLPENSKNRHPFAYLPFSAGPRNCIGQKFAMLELKAALSSILRSYILEPVHKLDDIVLMMDIIIRPKNGIKIKFKPRPDVV